MHCDDSYLANTSADFSDEEHTLDIRHESCPMTYVRTRLRLDALKSGEKLLVLLCGDEPRRNVPQTATSQGHVVIAQETDQMGVTRLLLRRA